MDSNLTKGWIETNLEQLQTTVIGGDWGIAQNEHKEDFVLCKVIRGTDFRYWDDERTGRSAIRKIKKSSLEKRQLDLGDIVIEVSGGGPDQPVGRTIIIDTKTLDNEKLPLTCSNFFRKVSLSKLINPFYINYHIRYAYGQGAFNDIQTHTTNLRNLRVDEYLKSPILLPPLPEQQRIVEKLDLLMARINNSKARLEKIPALLKNFRQSVLAAAVSGELTKEWREENSELKPYFNKGSNSMESESFNFEFPDNWRAAKLSELINFVTSGSRGWAKYYSDKGSVFIRAQNINSDFLNLDDIAFVKLPNNAEGVRTKVQKDDILITITGANVTKSALINEPIDNAYVSQHVALVRLSNAKLSKFIYYGIICPTLGRKQLLDAAYGQGKPGLNLDNIKSVVIGVPPLEEQKEIVRKVEELFHFADSIEARYQKAKAWFDKLPQAILAKAFRGELVPQDESDEPASELLKRIQQEKHTISKQPKTTALKAKRRKSYKIDEDEELRMVAEG